MKGFPRSRTSLRLGGRRHSVSQTHILPDGFNLLLGVAIVVISQRTFPLCIEVNRHFGRGFDAQRIAHPAVEKRFLHPRAGVGEIDALAFEDLHGGRAADRMAGDAEETAVGRDELPANLRRFLVNRRLSRSPRWKTVLLDETDRQAFGMSGA